MFFNSTPLEKDDSVSGWEFAAVIHPKPTKGGIAAPIGVNAVQGTRTSLHQGALPRLLCLPHSLLGLGSNPMLEYPQGAKTPSLV